MQMIDQQPSRGFRPGACQKCGGDAFFDRGDDLEWRCLQCGRPLMPYASAHRKAFGLEADADLLTAEQTRDHGGVDRKTSLRR